LSVTQQRPTEIIKYAAIEELAKKVCSFDTMSNIIQ